MITKDFIQKIYAHVEKTHRLEKGSLSTETRRMNVVAPRTAVWLALHDCGASSVMIASAAERNHTSILAGLKSENIRCTRDFPEYYATALTEIKQKAVETWGEKSLIMGFFAFSQMLRKNQTKQMRLEDEWKKVSNKLKQLYQKINELEDQEQDICIALNKLKANKLIDHPNNRKAK